MRTNNAVYIESIGSWFHESCKPVYTPEITKTVDMCDPDVMSHMLFTPCVACLKPLILGNGRISYPLQKYETFLLNEEKLERIEKIIQEAIGGRLTVAGREYIIVNALLYASTSDPRNSTLLAICDPVEDVHLVGKADSLRYSLELVKSCIENKLLTPEETCLEILSIVDYALTGQVKIPVPVLQEVQV